MTRSTVRPCRCQPRWIRNEPSAGSGRPVIVGPAEHQGIGRSPETPMPPERGLSGQFARDRGPGRAQVAVAGQEGRSPASARAPRRHGRADSSPARAGRRPPGFGQRPVEGALVPVPPGEIQPRLARAAAMVVKAMRQARPGLEPDAPLQRHDGIEGVGREWPDSASRGSARSAPRVGPRCPARPRKVRRSVS